MEKYVDDRDHQEKSKGQADANLLDRNNSAKNGQQKGRAKGAPSLMRRLFGCCFVILL